MLAEVKFLLESHKAREIKVKATKCLTPSRLEWALRYLQKRKETYFMKLDHF